MAETGSRSTFSLSRFNCLETEAASAENDDEDEVHECVSSIEDEKYLQILLDKEREQNHIQSPVEDWIKVARSEAIEWIINTRALFQFRFHTAYLSVVYIDRSLLKGLIDNDKHWAIRLLSVACLSLAAKMGECNVPALSKFPTEGYNFESRVIQRMELLVLTTLEWRIHPVTPFDFIHCFISCFFNESPKRQFVSLTTQILFATTKDIILMGHRSSTIAMAATLLAMDQKLTRLSLEIKVKTTWLHPFLDLEDVYACYNQMLELEPGRANIAKPVSANPFENPPASSAICTKRRRLTFDGDREKKPHQ